MIIKRKEEKGGGERGGERKGERRGKINNK